MIEVMDKVVIGTEFLLYISFAVLVGGLILRIVPQDKRPTIKLPKALLVILAVLIPIFSFAPLLETVVILGENMDFRFIFSSILFTFEVGKAWLFILCVSMVLILLLALSNEQRSYNKVSLFFTLLMCIGIGYGSHAASITNGEGLFAHTLHFIAVMVWGGGILVVSWFAKDHSNWKAFLKWFSPLAISCIVILVIAGFYTMSIDINSYEDLSAGVLSEYKNSLVISYGQSLLIKHLTILPLLVFAVINGILIRRSERFFEKIKPLKWIRLESIFVILVLFSTAFIGQGYPPHQVTVNVQTDGPSKLFDFIYQEGLVLPVNIAFDFGLASIVLMGAAIFLLGAIALSFKKRLHFIVPLFAGLIFIVVSYLSIMLGIQ